MTARPHVLDCLVVGGGPAGMTAALYLRRFWRHVRVIDSGDARAARIPESHNYPGFPSGIPGTELLARLRQQLAAVEGEVDAGEVTVVGRDHDLFAARIGDEAVRARTVLLATGRIDHEPHVTGIDTLRERGLLRQCPICDGYEFTGRRIAVIGAGVHGLRECQFLCRYSPTVTLIDESHDADIGLAADLEQCGARRVRRRLAEVALRDDDSIELRFDDGSREPCDVLYAALGGNPRSALARSLGARVDGEGGIVVDAHCETTVPGLFAAGDVVTGLDQLAVAVGQAAIAATAIHNRLRAAA